MPDYTLAYWPIPFRGEFVRAALAETHATWDEAGIDDVADARAANPAAQPVPHMGPPLLTDHARGLTLNQTAAILDHLGHAHGLMPEVPALAHKLIADANDVLMEMTRMNGAHMWDRPAWESFRPRLIRWMEIFEETGRRHGLRDTGFFLGTEAPTLADVTVHTLWGTMTRQLAPLRPLLEMHAPETAALSDRFAARPRQTRRIEKGAARWGDAWCGGQIEASLREVLD